MAVHAYNPSFREVQAGKSLRLMVLSRLKHRVDVP